jgi:hypothetical protein
MRAGNSERLRLLMAASSRRSTFARECSPDVFWFEKGVEVRGNEVPQAMLAKDHAQHAGHHVYFSVRGTLAPPLALKHRTSLGCYFGQQEFSERRSKMTQLQGVDLQC